VKRIAIIAGIILSVVVAFFGTVKWNVYSQQPEVLLQKLRAGKGDQQDLWMRFNLARGDTVTPMLEALADRSAPAEFRAELIELLARRFSASGRQDEIIAAITAGLADEDPVIRRRAVFCVSVYLDSAHQPDVFEMVADPDLEVRRGVYGILVGTGNARWRRGDRNVINDELWKKMTLEQRQTLVQRCQEQAAKETDEDLRMLALSVVGREIEFLCTQSIEADSRGQIDQAEQLLDQALAIDPASHQARIRLVRHHLAIGRKEEALALAEENGALLRIPRLAAEPRIDGDPSDEAWNSAFRYEGHPFYHATSRFVARQVTGKTDFYIGHRDGKLYLAIIGHEDDLDELVIKCTRRDSPVWQDDSVEIFFDPALQETKAHQFVINAAGALADLNMGSGWISHNYACQYAGKVFEDRGYWACEFAIPADELDKAKITADAVWGLNIMRARIGPASEQCAWWPTYGFSHRYHLYPIAIFEDAEPTSTSAPAGSP